MKKIVFLSFLFVFSLLLFPKKSFAQVESSTVLLEGKVIQIVDEGKETVHDQLKPYQELKLEIYKGDSKENEIIAKNTPDRFESMGAQYQEYNVGDKLKIAATTTETDILYDLNGQVKRDGLITLALIFIIVVLLVGRLWGALSLVGLVISFLVIFKIIVPMIVNGYDPVLSAIIGSIIIVPTTFYISHGFNKKTHVGVISTFIALIITGLLAAYFIDKTHLTGFASEEAGFLQVERQGSIDIRGLLLAGMIIGTLGVLDDVTIGQASLIKQLKKVNPKIKMKDLFENGMKVGQDHISSMVNTLMLVYAGAALPLLLLFFDSQKGFSDILEFEMIAEEIVRMLVSSIGLVLAAPLATILAAYAYTKWESPQSEAISTEVSKKEATK